MIPKGKNVGLSTKERKEWAKKVVLEVLTEHLCVDYGQYWRNSRMHALIQEGQDSPLYELATHENLSKVVKGVGFLNIVAYVQNVVFQDADKIEENAFNKDANLQYPGHNALHNVIILAKQGKWLEAVDAAFLEPRRRKAYSCVYPFLQEDAQDQPNLGAYVRRFLSCSPPDKLSQAIRMRKYALNQGALGKFVQDNPKDLAAFYWNSILQDLQVESLPTNLHQLAMAMIQSGASKESITNAIKQVNFGELQTIPTSTKTFCGFTFQIVPKTDDMVIQASDINDSCMYLGGVANDCVIDILSNPRAALLIIKHAHHNEVNTEDCLQPDIHDRQPDIHDFFRNRMRIGQVKLETSLKDQGYVGYSYIRHGLSNTLYLDNVELVEQNEEGKKVLGIALFQWIRSTMHDLGSKRALVGKAYSQGVLDYQALPKCHLYERQLFQDMPEDVKTYADICKPTGAWEITIDARMDT